MKSFKPILLIAHLGIIGMSIGCEKEDLISEESVTGTVIGKDYCLNATLIQINSTDVGGKDILYGDSVAYQNVIKVNGLYPKGKISFTVREYDPENDKALFESTEPCLWIYAPLDVPKFVITQSNCSSDN